MFHINKHENIFCKTLLIKAGIFCPLFFQLIPALEAVAAEDAQNQNLLSMIVRMLSVLAFIVGLILIVFFILKKINFRGNVFLNTKKCMKIVETLYVGPKKNITLLKVGCEFLLIAVTNTQINFLSKINFAGEEDKTEPKTQYKNAGVELSNELSNNVKGGQNEKFI